MRPRTGTEPILCTSPAGPPVGDVFVGRHIGVDGCRGGWLAVALGAAGRKGAADRDNGRDPISDGPGAGIEFARAAGPSDRAAPLPARAEAQARARTADPSAPSFAASPPAPGPNAASPWAVGCLPDLAGLWDALGRRFPGAALVLIDIPLGLPGPGLPVRACDGLARRLLGPRRASVFSPPCRAALTAPDYRAALAAQRAATGRGLSLQAYHIGPKILEADELLRARPEARARLLEAHPELAFAALAPDGRPMAHPKRSAPGAAARRAVLAAAFDAAPGLMDSALEAIPRRLAAPDDLLDALALALLARAAGPEGLVPLPDPPERDEAGIAAAIRHWPRNPQDTP